MTDKIAVFNTHTGQTGLVSRVIFESDYFNPRGELLVEAGDQKPYVPELFNSKFDQGEGPEETGSEPENDEDE